MARENELPLPRLDALLLGAHRSVGAGEDRVEVVGAEGASDVAGTAGASGVAGAAGAIGLPILTDEQLFATTGVRIAFTSREGGVSEGPFASLNCALHVEDDEDAVKRNRQIVLQALGAPQARLIVPSQVHGTHIVCVGSEAPADEESEDAVVAAQCVAAARMGAAWEAVDEPSQADAASEPSQADAASESLQTDIVSAAQREAADGADAIVVNQQNVAALLNFADCLPLIIVSPDGSFAVAHAGWRGAVARIASKAARALAGVSGCEPSQFNAYIGPHIREECFEVGTDVADAFAGEFGPDVLADERHVSLARAVTSDLMSAGLKEERIADASICTKCHPDQYFSYRATNGKCGRHSAVAVRVGSFDAAYGRHGADAVRSEN